MLLIYNSSTLGNFNNDQSSEFGRNRLIFFFTRIVRSVRQVNSLLLTLVDGNANVYFHVLFPEVVAAKTRRFCCCDEGKEYLVQCTAFP